MRILALVICFLSNVQDPLVLTFRPVIIMPPFEEKGVYCFAHVDRSVCLSVHQMVSGL